MKAFKIISISILFIVVFSGGIMFALFTNEAQSSQSLHTEERNELDTILLRPDVLREKADADERTYPLRAARDKLVRLTEAGEGPYYTGIAKLDGQITEAKRPYNELIEKLQKPIREHYTARRAQTTSVRGYLSGIQSGIIVNLMALVLAIFATMYDDWQRIAYLISAFVAQLTAVYFIHLGAQLKFNDPDAARLLAITFFLCEPLLFHAGSIFMVNDMRPILWRARRTETQLIPVQIEKPATVAIVSSETEEQRELPEDVALLKRLADHCIANDLPTTFDNLEQAAVALNIQMRRSKIYRKVKKFASFPLGNGMVLRDVVERMKES